MLKCFPPLQNRQCISSYPNCVALCCIFCLKINFPCFYQPWQAKNKSMACILQFHQIVDFFLHQLSYTGQTNSPMGLPPVFLFVKNYSIGVNYSQCLKSITSHQTGVVAAFPPNNRAQDRNETETNFPNAKNPITITSQTIMYKTHHHAVGECPESIRKECAVPKT